MIRSRDEAERLVLDVLRANADSLLRVARRHSLCLDDAQDAYQRSVEIFLRHAATLEAGDAHKWLHTVCKHEAMRVRASRMRVVGGEEADLDSHEAGSLPTPDEQVASFDLMTRSAEALQRLKPQELRALWLRAQGHSYQEIAELEGWTYTKVNRCITEGRRSFLDRYEDIGSGVECRRWEPVLSAMVDGEASAKDLAAARPHLRHCAACRARVRTLRESSLGLAALLPPGAVVEVRDHGGLLARLYEAVAGPVQERVVLSATKLQAGVEAALPGKLAVAAAGAAAIAGGGVAVQRVVDTSGPAEKRAVVARPAVPRPAAVRAVTAVPPTTVSRPRLAPGRTVSRRVAAKRTTKAEFGLSRNRAKSASNVAAAREFAPAPASSAATAASSAPGTTAPVSPAPETEAQRTAEAEFGGG